MRYWPSRAFRSRQVIFANFLNEKSLDSRRLWVRKTIFLKIDKNYLVRSVLAKASIALPASVLSKMAIIRITGVKTVMTRFSWVGG